MSFAQRQGPRQRILGAALAAVVALTACGGSGGSTDADDTVTVSVPQLGDVLHTTRAVGSILGVLLQGLEPLVLYQPDGSVKPNLAETFEHPTPTRYTFTLREDVEFWDGSPFTSADVAASFQVHMGSDSQSASASYWTGVESVSASGDHEIVVDLAAPDAGFLFTVARTGIFSAAYAEEHGDELGSPGVLNMGTGPYRFESFEPLSQVELVRNADYWGEQPEIPRIDAQVLNRDTLLPALQSGAIDASFELPVSQLESFRGLRDFELSSVPAAATYKLNLSVDKAPWDDPYVRRAFAHTVDRKTIAEDVLNGAKPATALMPSFMFGNVLPDDQLDAGYREMSELMPHYDLDKAARELAQSSQPEGFSTEVLVHEKDPNLSAVVQTVAQSAAEIGIEIDIRQVDEATYNEAVYLQHTTEGLSIDNFESGSPDYLNIPDLTLNSSNIPPTGFTDVADYRNDTVDDMLMEASSLESEDARRGELVMDVLKRAASDLPYVPVAHPEVYLGLKDAYSYPEFNAFWWMSRWPEFIVEKGS